MSVGRTEIGWDMGMSFRGFASVVSVILNEASLRYCHCSTDFQNLHLRRTRPDQVKSTAQGIDHCDDCDNMQAVAGEQEPCHLFHVYVNESTTTDAHLGYIYSRPARADDPFLPMTGADNIPEEFYAGSSQFEQKQLEPASAAISDNDKVRKDRVLH